MVAWAGVRFFWQTGASDLTLNISCWTYHDVDRSGSYDVGDRPYPGLRVELDRPDGSVVKVESNLEGFANFKMGRRRGDVREPGAYRYRAIAPEGWELTSGAAPQPVTFKELEGSPVGLVAANLCVPIGVAPRLTLSGRVERAAGAPAAPLEAIGPSGARVRVAPDADGRFEMPATSGEWRLLWADAKGLAVERRVRVDANPVVFSTLRADASDPPAAPKPRKIDFDALVKGDTLVEIPNGFAGLEWTNWVVTHPKVYGTGFYHVVVSPEYVAYNSSGHPATIWSARPFDLAGTYVALVWPQAEPRNVVVRAWRGDRLAYEESLRLRAGTPVWFDADWRAITRIEFAHEAYWQVAVDDLVVRTE